MIAAIRISGMIRKKGDVVDTLFKLRLRKKYTCVLINETVENMGMIKRVRDFIAYGNINEKTLIELIKARAKIIGNKKAKVKDAEKIAKELISGKKPEELGIKPFFGLHPARGGLVTKKPYPKGALGNHKEKINDLIRRML